MKDMLDKEVQLNDLVVYVCVNKNGKISTNVGRVVAINNARFKILTENGVLNVQNVIRLEQNNIQKKSISRTFSILNKVKSLLHN